MESLKSFGGMVSPVREIRARGPKPSRPSFNGYFPLLLAAPRCARGPNPVLADLLAGVVAAALWMRPAAAPVILPPLPDFAIVILPC